MKQGLSMTSLKLIDLYELEDLNLNNNEAVQSIVNTVIECKNLIKIREYNKLLTK